MRKCAYILLRHTRRRQPRPTTHFFVACATRGGGGRARVEFVFYRQGDCWHTGASTRMALTLSPQDIATLRKELGVAGYR